MLMDIFSSFDEQNGNFLGVGLVMWFSGVFFMVFFASCFWWGTSRASSVLDLVSSFVYSQVLRGRGKLLGGFASFVCSLMIFLLSFNLSGLFPYVFSSTSHLVVTFVMGSVLWLSLILSSSFYSLSSFIAVFLPVGAPGILNPFWVLVETVSLSVRPITLSVRLAANMGAGHIVLCLLGSYLSSGFFLYSFSAVGVLLVVGVFYFVFEIGVCLIQAYIFFLLLNLYGDEHC
uniref:ATP synthase subunit a n=1 Tax=Kulikovia alborostrata TaxID=187796 RepID=I6MR65_9BILA|nr:ATP synthase F0 subunit 6 [Kulikovia alborostrata]AEM23543.1 ATP synthase F0 subunit 6 [Kulikovia alborostrata]